MKTMIAAALSVMALVGVAAAQTGPVATNCRDDIAKYCAGEAHDGSVRACLEDNYDKVSPVCQQSLDTTGGARGARAGKGGAN